MQAADSGTAVYLGSAAMLLPGDRLPAGLPVTADPAQALANAWRLAGARNRHGDPHVYELTQDRHALVVIADMAITPELASQATTMTGTKRERGHPAR